MVQFDAFREPTAPVVSPVTKTRTVPSTTYRASGNGRDSYMGATDGRIPHTGPVFGREPPKRGVGGPLGKKDAHPTGVRAGYVPNGTGRDCLIFMTTGDILPRTGKQFNSIEPDSRRHSAPFAKPRTDPGPKFISNGTGRDHFQGGRGASLVHKAVKGIPNINLQPRTAPPPRFMASGSGRDTFHDAGSESPLSVAEGEFGFGPPRYDPASLSRPKTSQQQIAKQRKVHVYTCSRPCACRSRPSLLLVMIVLPFGCLPQHMATLSRPRTSFSPERAPDSGFLLVPGSNLRKYC